MYIDFLNKDTKSFFCNLDACYFGRILIALIIVSLAISPLLVNIFEVLLIILCVCSKKIIRKIAESLKSKMIIYAVLLFLIYIAYSFLPLGHFNFGAKKILMIIPAYVLFKDDKDKLTLIKYFLCAMVILASISFLTFFLGISIVSGMDVGVVARNEVVQSLFFVAAINILLVFRGKLFFYSCNMNILMLIILVLNILVVSPAKSGYAGLIIVGCFFIWYENSYKINIRVIIKIALCLMVFSSILAINNKSNEEIITAISEVENYQSAQEVTSMGIRMIFLKNTYQILKKNPFLGSGTESFGDVYGTEVQGRLGIEGVISKDPHNQYLRIWVEQGILGLVIFLSFICSSFFQKSDKPYKYLGISLLAVWCFNSLFHSHFSTFCEGGFIFIWLGVMLSSKEFTSTSS